jgi:hypothetical protein
MSEPDVMDMIRQRMSATDAKREQMRRNFPETAAIVDDFRAAFGDGVKVTWCCENGREVGKQTWGERA